MIFYNDKRPDSTITSKKNHKRIAQFVEGKFETKNEIIIDKLKKRFRCEESPKVLSNIANFIKLRQEVAKLGINTQGMKKKDLEKVLEEVKK